LLRKAVAPLKRGINLFSYFPRFSEIFIKTRGEMFLICFLFFIAKTGFCENYYYSETQKSDMNGFIVSLILRSFLFFISRFYFRARIIMRFKFLRI